jgi:hypothetical protein
MRTSTTMDFGTEPQGQPCTNQVMNESGSASRQPDTTKHENIGNRESFGVYFPFTKQTKN